MKLLSCARAIWRWIVCNRHIVSLLVCTGCTLRNGVVVLWDWLTSVWWYSWKWLRTNSSNLESGSTTIP